jgi:hypothetical protein
VGILIAAGFSRIIVCVRLMVLLGAALLAATLGGVARAQPTAPQPSQAARLEAKALADEGLALVGKGDLTTAVDRFARAEALVPLPTIALHRARALERLGRWVEARAAYQKVLSMPARPNAPFVHKQAVADAKKELATLEPRIPQLTIVVSPPKILDVSVTINGRPEIDPQEPFFRLDPGEHVVEVQRSDGIQARRTVSMAAGERRTLEIAAAQPAPLPTAPPDKGMPILEVLGWIGVGVGGAALVVAASTGIPAIGLRDELVTRCPNDVCPPDAYDDLSRYDALRWTSGVHLIAGVVLAGAGSGLVGWSRSRGEEGGAPPKVEALLGPLSAGARVRF